MRPISEALPGSSATFRGRLSGVKRIHTRRRGFSVVRGAFKDDSGSIPVVWFNRPYLAGQGLETGEWLLHGEVREGKGGRELLNPSCERPEEAVHGARIVPVYPAAGPLGPALLRRIFDGILADLDLASQVPEPLPQELLDRRGLPPFGEALRDLHLPGDVDVEALNQRKSPAHRRLIYQELFELQLGLAVARGRRGQEEEEVQIGRAHV